MTAPLRLQNTIRKHVCLTPQGLARIEAWAKENELNFSAAIETLALVALEKESVNYIIPALRATALQALQLSFNRLARLLSDIAVESAVARTTSEGILLQLLREVAATHPDDFEEVVNVRRDGSRDIDARIRRLHKDIKAGMEAASVGRLRDAVSQVEELLAGEEEE
jgi:hypothetical protein